MPDVREYQSVVEEAEQAARAGDFALADLRLRDALRLQEASLGTDHPDLASTLNNLAVVCETLSRFDDAELFYRRAYAIASGSLPPGDPLVVTSRENLKDFCSARGLPLEEWPEIGRAETPAPSPPPPPVAPTPAGAPRPAAATSRTRPSAAQPPRDAASAPAAWPTRVIGAVVVLAAIGAIVVVTSWRETAPAGRPATVAATPPDPTPAATPAAPAAAEPVVVTPPPAAVAPAEPAVVTAAVVAPPADVRIVVADVCATLSTSGAWRCTPLGATAAPGRAAFYTRIAAPRPIRVQHRWYQGTALRQSVTLSVGASPTAGYRTFSRQTLTPGAWRVELRGADGAVLHAAAFDIQ